MPKYNEIASGYRITVGSWENDGDVKQTIIKDGFTEDEAHFIVDTLKVGKYYGNLYEPSEQELSKLYKDYKKVLEKYPVRIAYYEADLEDPDSVLDVFQDIYVDFAGYSETYYTRVVESIRVEYIPDTIFIEDVGHQF